MNRYVPSILSMLVFYSASAQQVLLTEDFEGSSGSFILNTSDVGSVPVGANTWLVNDVFTGGDGSVVCIGFPIDFTIPSTPAQPAAITPTNGNYLHTASTEAVADGVLCCSFGAADGFCTDAGNHFAHMANDISTTGLSGVTLDFWWLCQGGSSNYGEVYFSTNAGSSWTLITLPIAQYHNQGSWAQQSITLPAFDGQPTLRFGFRFVNGVGLIAADPGFAIDDITISASNTQPATLETGAVPSSSYCTGATFVLPYTTSGTFDPGNSFNVELSDANGNFGTPVVIGSVASVVSGSISCIVPGGLLTGSGYRVRVVSDQPVLIGEPNALDLTISTPPSAGSDATVQFCPDQDPIDLFQELGGAPDVCGTWTGPDLLAFGGLFDPLVHPAGIYTYTTNCPGACPQDESNVVVSALQAASAGNDVQVDLCSSDPPSVLSAFVDGGSTTGQFFYQGQPFPLPNFTIPGTYPLQYVVEGSSCPSDTANFEFNVIASPVAGNSLSYTVCVTVPPFEMISLLFNAQPGGMWTGPSGGSFSGMLDPSTGLDGLYTYTVPGTPPCADSQAFVALVIDPCTGIKEQGGASPLKWIGQRENTHTFLLNGAEALTGMELFDASGRSVVQNVSTMRDRVILDMKGTATGVYLLSVRSSKGLRTVRLYHQQEE